MHKFLSDRQIAERYSVCRSSIWRWINTRNFPRPVKVGENTTRWELGQVEAWEQRMFPKDAAE